VDPCRSLYIWIDGIGGGLKEMLLVVILAAAQRVT